MRVEWAVACRYAEVHDGLATIVGAGIDRVVVPKVPAQVNVWICARFAIAPVDTGEQHQLRIEVSDPSMRSVGTIPGQFQAGPQQPHMIPGWEGHHMVPLNVGFRAQVAGPHLLTISATGSSVDVPLIVDVRQPT